MIIHAVCDCRGGCRTVALGGGIVRKTVQTNVSQKEGKCLCITFTQDICTESDFNASSVVIQGDDLSPREFEAHLLKVCPSSLIMLLFSVYIPV